MPGRNGKGSIKEAIRADDLRRLERLLQTHAPDGEGDDMFVAIEHGASIELVRLIADHLPNNAFKAYAIPTPLHEAGARTDLEVIRFLNERYPEMVTILDDLYNTCLQTAVRNGVRLNGIKYLYDRLKKEKMLVSDYDGRNPLHFVGRDTPHDVVQFLADKNRKFARDGAVDDEFGTFPLHAAVDNGAGLGAVRILYEKYPRAIVRTDREYGRLPLHYAAKQSTPDVVKFLLDRFMDAARTADRESLDLPLHKAASRRDGASKRVVRRILKAWPQAIHEKNRKGQTPLQLAQESDVRDPAVLDLLTRGLPK